MKLPRRRFLHLAAGAAALPAVSRIAWGASLAPKSSQGVGTNAMAKLEAGRR